MTVINSSKIVVLDFKAVIDIAGKTVTVDLTGTEWRDEEDKDVSCKVVVGEIELPFDPAEPIEFLVPGIADGAEIEVVVTDNGVEYSDTKSLESVSHDTDLQTRFVPDRINKRVIAVTRNLPIVSEFTGVPFSAFVEIYNPLHEKTETDFLPISLTYYPGRYELNGVLVGSYDFGNQIFYHITYKVCTVFNVQSVNYNLIFSRLHQLLMQNTCTESDLDEAFYKLSLVLVGSENNIDVSTLLEDLEELLGITGLCDYEESETDSVPAADVLIDGCNVEVSNNGSTVKYKINNYDYVLNFAGTQGSVTRAVTISGCKKTTVHTFDFAKITEIVVNQIKTSGSIISVVNDAMNGIDPDCIATSASWKAMSFPDKWKAILTKVCSCITLNPGDLDFEFDCDQLSTTDEFTLGVESAGFISVKLLYGSGEGNVVINVTGSGFTGTLLVEDLTEDTTVQVPVEYDGSGDAGGIVEVTVSANDQECTLQIEILEEEDCSAPRSPLVAYDGGDVTISALPAVVEPPSYSVLRRRKSDPDISGSYTTIGTPTLNIGTGRYEITETFGTGENNKLWVYKFQSNCESGARPFVTVDYAKLICPEVTATPVEDVAEVTWAPVGGDVNRYVYGIYDGATLIGSLRTLNSPFGLLIEDSFTGLANGTYTVKVQSQIASTDWTSGECDFEVIIDVVLPGSNATFTNNAGDGNYFVGVAIDGLYEFWDCTGSEKNFTLSDAESAFCTHEGFNATITVKTTLLGIGSVRAKLYKNGAEADCVALSPGMDVETSFASPHIFAADDDLEIVIESGICV